MNKGQQRFLDLVAEMPELDCSVLASSRYPSRIYLMKEKIEQWLWCYIQRPVKFFWQRRTRGWDDSETWNLDVTMARFLGPRLRRLKELQRGHPTGITEEEWNTILDKILWSLEYLQDEDKFLPPSAVMTDRELKIHMPLFEKVEHTEEEKVAADAKFAHYCQCSRANDERCQEGLNLLGKWMRALWW